MRRGPGVLLPILGLLIATAARAVSLPDLYAAGVLVPDQSRAARVQAFRQDLVAVLVKVSGNPDISRVAGLAALLSHPGEVVMAYRYQVVAPSRGGGSELWARFDPKLIDMALSRAGQPIWGRDRPRVVAWVLTPNGIQGDDISSPIAVAMLRVSRRRGLPLVLPLMDLTDRRQVNTFDITSFFLSPLWQASKRYGAQALLVGSVGGSDQAPARWQLAYGSNVMVFRTPAPTPQSAAAAAVGRAATLIAQQLAYIPGTAGAGRVVVVVSGIGSLEAEVRVRRLLVGMQGVSRVRLLGVRAGEVDYAVTYAGVPTDLGRSLQLSGLLDPVMAPASAGTASSPAALPSGPGNRVRLYFSYKP